MTAKEELAGRLRRAEIRLLNAAWEDGATSEYVRRTLSETASLCREVAAALTEAGAGEAVAWRWTLKDIPDDWRVGIGHPQLPEARFLIEPLYASPPPVQPVVRALTDEQIDADPCRYPNCGCGDDVCQAAKGGKLSPLKAEVERLTNELWKIADYVERHWKGAGLKLEASWIINTINHWHTEREKELEAAEAEADRLRQGIARLASKEAFGFPRSVRLPHEELMARIDFARSLISTKPGGE